MASRNVVQQQNRGDAVPEVHKQKKVGAERKSRRALGDIGNLVTVRGVVDGKQIPQVYRRVTRSFSTQLQVNAQVTAAENKKVVAGGALANAQVTAAENKKAVAGGALADKKADVKKAVQKKVAVKSKPAEIIEISPDSGEVAAEKEKLLNNEKSSKKNAPTCSRLTARSKVNVEPKPAKIIEISPDSGEVAAEKEELLNNEKSAEKSSKKNAPTFSSRLTARSKAACELNNKHKDQIVDIDAADVDNDLAAVEYVEDMYKYYKSAEGEGRVHDYMDSQPEINEKMRAILIDWLVQVHNKFELSQETLYLTINLVDRYLAATTTLRRELQLVGLGSLLIASKYEEIWAPEVNELVSIADRTYSNEQVLVMEKRILGELEWQLTVPTAYVFLVRFIKASMTEANVENMVYFLAELGMMNYETIIHCPSMIAASAVYVARCTLNKTPFWTETLKAHTGFSEEQLMDCAKLLASYHWNVAEDQKLRGIYRKYSSSERWAVALLPPAKSLAPASFSS